MEGAHGLLLQDVAGEEEEGREDEDLGFLLVGGGRGPGGRDLPTLEEIATEIWPLVRSMVLWS